MLEFTYCWFGDGWSGFGLFGRDCSETVNTEEEVSMPSIVAPAEVTMERGGVHLVEFHAPTAGMGFSLMVFLGVAVMGAIALYKRRLQRRRRHLARDEEERRRKEKDREEEEKRQKAREEEEEYRRKRDKEEEERRLRARAEEEDWLRHRQLPLAPLVDWPSRASLWEQQLPLAGRPLAGPMPSARFHTAGRPFTRPTPSARFHTAPRRQKRNTTAEPDVEAGEGPMAGGRYEGDNMDHLVELLLSGRTQKLPDLRFHQESATDDPAED